MVTRKIAAEDRLVMSDPVAEQVQPSHPVLDIGTDAAWVTLGWVVRERRCEGRHVSRVPRQSPGTVPASANGRGYVFSDSTCRAPPDGCPPLRARCKLRWHRRAGLRVDRHNFTRLISVATRATFRAGPRSRYRALAGYQASARTTEPRKPLRSDPLGLSSTTLTETLAQTLRSSFATASRAISGLRRISARNCVS